MHHEGAYHRFTTVQSSKAVKVNPPRASTESAGCRKPDTFPSRCEVTFVVNRIGDPRIRVFQKYSLRLTCGRRTHANAQSGGGLLRGEWCVKVTRWGSPMF